VRALLYLPGRSRATAALIGLAFWLLSGSGLAQTTSFSSEAYPRDWVVDPTMPGENLPPVGRSLFDFLVVRERSNQKVYDVPFPISALMKKFENSNGAPLKQVLIPLGRSLQRTSAAPFYFKYPRVVAVADAQARRNPTQAGILLKDRVYLGYQEKANLIEVISYNEAAGRFEFQVVKDYRPGGTPQVFYANRAICTACHQNAAPIFSRPVWDETNANTRIAALLGKEKREFYGIAPDRGVDVPNAIDDATDRANLYSAYQLLWRSGCDGAADRKKAARCRAGLFIAALQYRMTAKKAFDATLGAYRDDVIAAFGQSAQRWPAGLQIPNPDIPNRDPLMSRNERRAVLKADIEGAVNAHDVSAGNSDIVPAFDPLSPRPALERWNPAEPGTRARLIVGLSEFIAESDAQRIDQHLQRLAKRRTVSRTTYEGDCQMTRKHDAQRNYRVDFECSAARDRNRGLKVAGRFYSSGNVVTGGTLDRVNVSDEAIPGSAELTAVAVASGSVFQRGNRASAILRLTRPDGHETRRGDGNALRALELTWLAGGNLKNRSTAPGTAKATVVQDFAPVQHAIESMVSDTVTEKLDVFADRPFRRASVMPALFERLGIAPLKWCCVDSTGMPQAAMESHTSIAGAAEQAAIKPTELQPFYRYCATCHQTADRFPPNFLQGSVTQVSANLNHCAPRLYVRLTMSKIALHDQQKTPMPPHYALHGFRVAPQAWAESSELAALIGYVGRTLERETGKAPQINRLLETGYENLRACLPEQG
jgi:hypothetical protein